MSSKVLYERMVHRLYAHWATLYPMAEWVDPESSIDRIVADIKSERERCAILAEEHECNPRWIDECPCQFHIAARIRSAVPKPSPSMHNFPTLQELEEDALE